VRDRIKLVLNWANAHGQREGAWVCDLDDLSGGLPMKKAPFGACSQV
jgi:hypothetical protein